MKYLLDTNICIYLMKGNFPLVVSRFRQFPINDIGVSAVSIAELEFGVANSSSAKHNRNTLDRWLSNLNQPAFDSNAARCYGTIRAQLQANGTPIGPLDMLLAAQAISLSATLVSNNLREFSRVRGLKVENWTTP
jgi:tRNA(fMet)-specific endonuclease VapC